MHCFFPGARTFKFLHQTGTTHDLNDEENNGRITKVVRRQYKPVQTYEPYPSTPSASAPSLGVTSILLNSGIKHNSFMLSQVRPFFVKTLLINKDQITRPQNKIHTISTPKLVITPPTQSPISLFSGYQDDFVQKISEYRKNFPTIPSSSNNIQKTSAYSYGVNSSGYSGGSTISGNGYSGITSSSTISSSGYSGISTCNSISGYSAITGSSPFLSPTTSSLGSAPSNTTTVPTTTSANPFGITPVSSALPSTSTNPFSNSTSCGNYVSTNFMHENLNNNNNNNCRNSGSYEAPLPSQAYQHPSLLSQSLPNCNNISNQNNQLHISQIHERDWNQEFNDVLESSLKERGERLHRLSLEFVEVATKIGKIIIEERNLPHHQKSVPPIFSSGFAGGEKYKVKGIFFKYAVNKNKLFASDEHAMKIAGHELKGHTALVSCGMMHGLKLGLMTLIDYRGFRLTATSSLPINDTTLVYGSCDGGNLVVSQLDVMYDVMKNCAKILNLKGHVAGIAESKQFMFGPCDLEGHLGQDGKLYVIDLARLFPPETPDRSQPGSFLYKLLRPELVKQFTVPLSSDAFTLFGRDNQQEHDEEVRSATSFLISSVIPSFASSLSNQKSIELKSIHWIVDEAHRAGINIRYLGKVRSLISHPHLRSELLSELTARILKNNLKAQLRECKSSHDLHYHDLILNFFNQFFIHFDSKMWTDVRDSVGAYFTSALSEEEVFSLMSFKNNLNLSLVYSRLQELTGVQFTSQTIIPPRPFSYVDIVGIFIKSKYMYAVPRIEADAAAELARSTNNKSEAKRFLQLAIDKYGSVLSLKPDDYVVLSNLGLVLSQLALIEDQDLASRSQLFELANEKFDSSLKIKQDDYRSLNMWAEALVGQYLCSKDASCLKKSLGLSFKAEALCAGSGSLNISRVCALQGKLDLCQKWLHNSAKYKMLPPNLDDDPSLSAVSSLPFFKNLCSGRMNS